MKGDKEFAGTLLGFDDYVNMVLQDVTEYDTTTGLRQKHDELLLNGNGVCMVCTGVLPWSKRVLTKVLADSGG